MNQTTAFFLVPKRLTETDQQFPHVDCLPPFAALKEDQEREQKAEHSSPGTYYVVLTSVSFGNIHKNNESEADAPSYFSYDTGDPNIFIQPHFEDVPDDFGF